MLECNYSEGGDVAETKCYLHWQEYGALLVVIRCPFLRFCITHFGIILLCNLLNLSKNDFVLRRDNGKVCGK